MTTARLNPSLIRSEEELAPRGLHRRTWRDVLPLGDTIAAAAIALTALALGLANASGAPAYQDDEGIYTAQAVAVQQGSLSPYTYWYDHPPFGWVQLAALAWIPQLFGYGDGTDVAAMRAVIALFFAVSAVLVYLIARRIGIALPLAILAAGVYVLSPLSAELARQVFLDSVATPWLLLAFYFALSPRLALWMHAASGASFAVAVLAKITSSVFGPALLLALVNRPAWRGRAFSVVGFLIVGGLVLAFFPVMALLRGELLAGPDHNSLQDGLLYQFASREGSGYLWEAGSARADLIAGWMHVDPYLPLVGALSAAVCLMSRRTQWISLAVVTFAVPLVASEGYLPAMYIIGGLPFLALAVGAAADLVQRGFRRLAVSAGADPYRPRPGFAAIALMLALLPLPAEQWVQWNATALTSDANADWRAARDWMIVNAERDDVVLVPFSIWQELHAAGWDDPWTLIALEKTDLDPDFSRRHPDGWREVQWIVDGPTVLPTIGHLGLNEAARAYENSDVVETFGSWSIRQVDG